MCLASERAQTSRRTRRDGRPAEPDLTGGRPVEAEEDPHQRRLAGSRLTDDAHAAARLDREIDAAQRPALAARPEQRRAGKPERPVDAVGDEQRFASRRNLVDRMVVDR